MAFLVMSTATNGRTVTITCDHTISLAAGLGSGSSSAISPRAVERGKTSLHAIAPATTLRTVCFALIRPSTTRCSGFKCTCGCRTGPSLFRRAVPA